MPEDREGTDPSARRAGEFPVTRWSLVLAAGARPSAGSRSALAELCESYWYPLFAYLRRKGHPAEEARDLVQGLFARLIEKPPFPALGPERGRFRSYLLVALRHYATNEWERACALKRGGAGIEIGIDLEEGENRYRRELVERTTAETLYERRWATALLTRVLERLRREYEAAGRGEVFARLQGVIAAGSAAPDYNRVARELGVAEGAVKVAAHRLRRRYRDALRREIAETVATPEEVEDEIRYLLRVLSQ